MLSSCGVCRSEECHSSGRQLENYISEVVVSLDVWSPVDCSGLQVRWVESQKLDYKDANRVRKGTNQRRAVNHAGGEEQDPQKLGRVTFKPTVCLLRCFSLKYLSVLRGSVGPGTSSLCQLGVLDLLQLLTAISICILSKSLPAARGLRKPHTGLSLTLTLPMCAVVCAWLLL